MGKITDPKELARRKTMLDNKVLADIQKHGWSDMSIFPTEDSIGPFFNYTVGLSERNHPDLIICGMSPEIGHGILGTAYDLIQGGTTLEPDTYSTEVLQGLRVAFLEVLDPLNNVAPMTMCHHLYGEVHGLQIVWPDAEDRFPWDEGFTEEFIERQPLLGVWRGV